MQITRHALIAWLRSVPRDHVVGETGSCTLCPVANYIRSCCDAEAHIRVYSTHHRLRFDEKTMHPAWLQIFIQNVDGERQHGVKVTAAEALELLI